MIYRFKKSKSFTQEKRFVNTKNDILVKYILL